MYKNKNNPAFTMVELLIVIVIIGILAAITIVSYTGITKKANESTIQADLANAKKQIELYKVIHGQYPTGLDQSTGCLTGNIAPSPDTNYCLKKSNSTATYTMSNADGTIYTLKLDNGTLAYKITESTGPTSIATTPIAESFVKTWGGASGDYGLDLVKTSEGGYAAAGYTTSYGAGAEDIFLTKYDASGNLTWNKTWGGTNTDYVQGLIQTSDGGYAVTGYTASFGAGSSDIFLAKYDASGNLSWNKLWGGANVDSSYSLAQTSDGGYVVTGYTWSYGVGNYDMLLAKYDASGNLIWNKLWGGAGNDVGYSLIQTNDGGCAVTGYTSSYGAGSNDMFLVKYDASGNLSWNKLWGGTGSDVGRDLTQISDGSYAVVGHTDSYGAGSNDMFLIKYDASGNLSWNKLWGGTGSDVGIKLTRISDDSYVITGYTISFGAGNDDVLLAKYDASGNLSWNKLWGGTGSDIGYGLIQTGDGGYAVIGGTASYGIATDMLLLKTNSSGVINNCTSPMCQTPTATTTTPSATVTSPTATVTTPSATVTTPSATITTPTATQTTVVAAP